MKNNLLKFAWVIILLFLCACAVEPSTPIPATVDDRDGQLSLVVDYLAQHEKPIPLWDRKTISGKELYQFVTENEIPIVWGSEDDCRGNSCIKRFCREEICTPFPQDNTPNPIVLEPSLRGDIIRMDELVDALAHEIFHYTQPFGNVDNTLFEEYWAHYVGWMIAGGSAERFSAYDSFDPTCLVKWFKVNNVFYGYEGLRAYPRAIIPLINISTNGCIIEEGCSQQGCAVKEDGTLLCLDIPSPTPAATTAYRLVCDTDKLGLLQCTEVVDQDDTNATSHEDAP